jgi:xanthine dehydrogenase accessory factor
MSRTPLAQDIHQAIVDLADAGRKFALAMVLKDTGHTPRKAGTKAIIEAGGAIHGTIGGGAVEAEAQRRAIEAIRAGRPVVFDFELEGTSARDNRPICGGSMRILVDPTAAAHRRAYAQAAQAMCERQRGVLVTTVRLAPLPQTTVQWFIEGTVPAEIGPPGGKAPRHFVRDASAEEGRMEGLVEPLALPPLLAIAGGGHIGQALAVLADLVGFQVVVVDDRSEFTDPALYPQGVATRCGDIARELAAMPLGGDTYVAIVTRGHEHDRRALAACLRKPAAYIGMIGSCRKVALLRKDMLESGVATEEEIGRVYAPIGLDIGAQTVPEIAASIVAQMIAVRRKGSAARMPLA